MLGIKHKYDTSLLLWNLPLSESLRETFINKLSSNSIQTVINAINRGMHMTFWCKLETELASWGKLGTLNPFLKKDIFFFTKLKRDEGTLTVARTVYTVFLLYV